MSNRVDSQRDTGYAWMTVFAFFATEVFVDGIRFSLGLLFVEWLRDFETGKGETAWVGSIMIAAYNLSGPFSGVIVNKAGCRVATILGSIIACLGFIGSFFATSILQLILTYSLMQGFGFGLIFLAGTVSVGRYFYKRRALAFGVAYGGSGIGTIIFNPIMPFMLDAYTWKGCMLIFAGLSLNCCVFGMLHRPLHVNISELVVTNDVTSDANNASGEQEKMLSKDEAQTNGHVLYQINNSNHDQINNSNHDIANGTINGSLVEEKKAIPRTLRDIRTEHLTAVSASPTGSHRSLYSSHRSLPVVAHNLFGSNISFEYMIERRQRLGSTKLTPSKHETYEGSATTDSENTNMFLSLMRQLFPRELVTDTNFIIMMVSSFLFGVAIFIPIGLLPDYCLHNGCEVSEASWLISVYGIGGTISRVAAGYLTDLPSVNSLYFFNVCLLLAGAFTCICALVTSFRLIAVYAFAYGLAIGATYIIQPIVLMEFFGDELLPEIIGILMLAFGFSNLIGTPIAGWMFDGTGSYMVSFLFTGALLLLSGASMFLVLCTKRGREVNRRRGLYTGE